MGQYEICFIAIYCQLIYITEHIDITDFFLNSGLLPIPVLHHILHNLQRKWKQHKFNQCLWICLIILFIAFPNHGLGLCLLRDTFTNGKLRSKYLKLAQKSLKQYMCSETIALNSFPGSFWKCFPYSKTLGCDSKATPRFTNSFSS